MFFGGLLLFFRREIALDDDVFPDMGGDIRFDALALVGKAEVGLCRIGEIIPGDSQEALISILAKRIVNVGLLAVCGKLHGWVGLNFCKSLNGRGNSTLRPVRRRHNSEAVYQSQYLVKGLNKCLMASNYCSAKAPAPSFFCAVWMTGY